MATDYKFKQASAVWIKGFETEMNILAGFRLIFCNSKDGDYVLKVSSASRYKVFLNGIFIGYGPIAAPHGYCRVDLIKLNKYLKHGRNVLAFEVIGYNANSFDTLDIPPFLRAEVLCGSNVVAPQTKIAYDNARVFL